MACSINPAPSLVTVFTIFIAFFSVSLASGESELPASTISAAPVVSPDFISPVSSQPAQSPDIFPLFPTPNGPGLPPSDSSMPLIPSSPSPPNPDPTVAPGPAMEFGSLDGSGLMQTSFSVQVDGRVGLSSVSVVVVFGAVLVSAAL